MSLANFFKRGSKKNPKNAAQSQIAAGESSKTVTKQLESIKSANPLSAEKKITTKDIATIDEVEKTEKSDPSSSILNAEIVVGNENKSQRDIEQDEMKEKRKIETQETEDQKSLHEVPAVEEEKSVRCKRSAIEKETKNGISQNILEEEETNKESGKDENLGRNTQNTNTVESINDYLKKEYPTTSEQATTVVNESPKTNAVEINITTTSTHDETEDVTELSKAEAETTAIKIRDFNETENKSKDESQFIEATGQISANEEEENDNMSVTPTEKPDSSTETEAEKRLNNNMENKNSDNVTKHTMIENNINSDIIDCKTLTENSECTVLTEPEVQSTLDKKEEDVQELSNNYGGLKSSDEVLKSVEKDMTEHHNSNIEENTAMLKESSSLKESQKVNESKTSSVMAQTPENIMKNAERDELYIQLNEESFESQLTTTIEKSTVLSDKETNLSIYHDISERIVSASLTEAFEELNLMFFEENEISNASINKKGNEDNDKNNNGNSDANQTENRDANQTENTDEDSNLNQTENNNENQDENGNENQTENGNANQNQNNNQNEIKIRVHRPLCKHDSGLASTDSEDFGENIVLPPPQLETNSNQKWKVGYLQVKVPAKARSRAKLKAWQKRWVVIQNDEFTCDEKNCFLMLSVYHSESGNSRRHSALFWRSVSSKKAVVYRCKSNTHPYAFTVADESGPLLHLASNSETESQEWIGAIRAILWPPNPVMQLEKVLNGNEFDVSFIDNEFSHRAGLLATYGCLMVTNRKLILNHPQTGHVIQEWYLNTVDKFHIVPQPRDEDANKVLVMHTSSDSSTGYGELRLYCNEAVGFLKSLASTIHKVLQYHSKGNAGRYDKELEEMAEWLTPLPTQGGAGGIEEEDYYKVPRRQVRSLLDIPNFIFDKPICETIVRCDPLASSVTSLSIHSPKLTPSHTSISTFSQDSGISTATSSSDFLNSSHTSFSIGGSEIRRQGKRYHSSSSESSDGYSPPYSPVMARRLSKKEEEEDTKSLELENS